MVHKRSLLLYKWLRISQHNTHTIVLTTALYFGNPGLCKFCFHHFHHVGQPVSQWLQSP